MSGGGRAGRGSALRRAFGWTYTLMYLLAFLALWEVPVRALRIPSYVLPSPSAIAIVFVNQARTIADNTLATLWVIAIGFLIGAGTGAALAILIHLVAPLRRTLLPALVALQSIPKVAVAPLIILWFGLGLGAKAIMVILFCFFPVLLNMLAGLSRVDPTVLDLMQVCKASKWQTFAKVELPNAMPVLFDGLKIALPLAVIGAIVAEFTSGQRGLGYLILIAASQFNTALTFSALVTLTIIAVILFSTIGFIQKTVLPWSAEHRRGRG